MPTLTVEQVIAGFQAAADAAKDDFKCYSDPEDREYFAVIKGTERRNIWIKIAGSRHRDYANPSLGVTVEYAAESDKGYSWGRNNSRTYKDNPPKYAEILAKVKDLVNNNLQRTENSRRKGAESKANAEALQAEFPLAQNSGTPSTIGNFSRSRNPDGTYNVEISHISAETLIHVAEKLKGVHFAAQIKATVSLDIAKELLTLLKP